MPGTRMPSIPGPRFLRLRPGLTIPSAVDSTPRERLAHPPERASARATGVVLVTVALFVLVGLSPEGVVDLPAAGVAAFAGLVLIAAWTHSPAALHVAIFSLLNALAYRTPELGTHPFPLLNALLAYGLIVLSSRRLRESISWLHTGSVEPGIRRLVIGAAAASLVAIPLWFALADPDSASEKVMFPATLHSRSM